MKRLGVAVLLLGVLAAGSLMAARWPSHEPSLDCAPDSVRLGADGVARCAPGAPLSPLQLLAIGGTVDLNRISVEDLAVVPGVGPKVAKAIVDERTRLGRFESWAQVDRVTGVGEVRLATLRASAHLRPDGGGDEP